MSSSTDKLLKTLLKPNKELKDKKIEVVIGPKTYAKLFEDLGPNTKITIKAEPLKKNHIRKVV
jgi:hypothetical protein